MQTKGTVRAVQHIRRMRGGSQAHLMRASDKNFYVVKFQNNPQDIRILANEYLGSKIGALLGLPMPAVRIIEISDWLITNSQELRIEIAGRAMPCDGGLQVGLQYVADLWTDHVFDYLPESVFGRVGNIEDFARVLTFDKWLGNCDGRQAIFTKRPKDPTYKASFIDQGHCFNAGEWTFPDLPLHGVYYLKSVYAHVTGWNSFEPTLSNIEAITPSQLWQIAKEMPPEWYDRDEDGLSRLIETLCKRQSLVRDLITAFRNSSINPFPKWV